MRNRDKQPLGKSDVSTLLK